VNLRAAFLTRTVIILSLVSLFTDIASEMLYPVLPLFLKSAGYSVLVIGILEGLAETIAGFSKGYFGALSDRCGRRNVFIRAGYLMSAVSKPLIGFMPVLPVIFLSRSIDRLGKGVRSAARDAVLVAESDRESRGRVFGFHRGMDTLGAALGPLFSLAYLFFYPGDYLTLFILALFPGLLGFFLTLLLKREKQIGEAVSAGGKKITSALRILLAFWKEAPAAYRLLVPGFLMLSMFNSSDIFLLLKGRENGLGDGAILGAYIFYNMVYALLSYPAGHLSDRFGFSRVYTGSLFIFAAVYFLIGSDASGWVFWAVMGLYGVFAAANESVARAWLSLYLPEDRRATGLGLFQTLSTLTFLVASPLSGLLWHFGSASLPFYVTGAAALASIVYFVLIRKRLSPHFG